MDGGVRHGRIAAVFAIGLAAEAGILWIWWPAGVVTGILLGVVATLAIGRRLQASAESAPDDLELLAALDMTPAAGSGRVVRTVLAPSATGRGGRASIR